MAHSTHHAPRVTSRGRNGRRGGAALEMLLVLPILLMLAFGTVDYGYYIWLKSAFQNAALDGVRAAVPSNATNADVASAVASYMTAAGLANSAYTVTLTPPDVSSAAPGGNINILVSATWGNVGTHMLGPAFGGLSSAQPVSGTAVMVKESN
jgi:Flp pilus assembly protein TadG